MTETTSAEHQHAQWSDDAAAIRGGATQLARRLRSERPEGSLPSNRISLLSHLARHGASSPAQLAAAEHHQDPALLAVAISDLRADGAVCVGDAPDTIAITDRGRAALQADFRERDRWLAEVLTDLPEDEVELLRRAARVMSAIADRPGLHRFHGAGSRH